MKLTLERAGVIAVLLLQYKWSRRGVELKPEVVQAKLKELADKTGTDIKTIYEFVMRWILPSVICASVKHVAGKDQSGLTTPYQVNTHGLESIHHELAIKLMALEHFEIIGLASIVHKMARELEIPFEEINLFVWEYLIPYQLFNEYGKSCQTLIEIGASISSGLQELAHKKALTKIQT